MRHQVRKLLVIGAAMILLATAIVMGSDGRSADAATGNSINIVDAGGTNVGFYTSIVLDSSGFPVISYQDVGNLDLKVIHCNDVACSGGNESISAPDTGGTVGLYTSLALDSLGRPVVAYTDGTNDDLKVLHCNDANCVGGGENISAVDTANAVGYYVSMVLDGAGNPVISYQYVTGQDLRIAHCNDANCSGGGESITTPDASVTAHGVFTSIELDSDGRPVVSYAETDGQLKVMHCNDINCAGGGETIATPDPGLEARWTSLELDAAGNPVVSYQSEPGFDLKVLHCGNSGCTASNVINSPDTSGNVGLYSSLALDGSGRPVVGYLDNVSGLQLLHCDDVNCAAGGDSITSPDPAVGGFGGQFSSLALDSSGNPMISHRDGLDDDLRVVLCNDSNCAGSNEAANVADGNTGDVGQFSSLTLDSSGNPVASYWDETNGGLKIAHCNDPNCAGANESVQSPDPTGVTFQISSTSMALDSLGRPVVAYYDVATDDLNILHCNDANCAPGGDSITSPDTTGFVGGYASLELDAIGNPVVSYWDYTNDTVKVLHCDDPNCAGLESPTSPDPAINVGSHTSLELDAAGNPVVSYYDYVNLRIRVMHCNDSNCAGANESISTPDPSASGGRTSLVLDSAGRPVVSYETASGPKLLHCNDADCVGSDESLALVDPGGSTVYSSLALDLNGNPIIAYFEDITDDLKIAHCTDANCAGSNETIMSPDTAGEVGLDTSLALDSAGRPVVSYYDVTNGDLKLVHCTNIHCGVAPDTDLDGCTDVREQQVAGGSQISGGLRNSKLFWDFFDVPAGPTLVRNKAVASNDFNAVLQRFGANDTGPGAFNRFSDPLSTPNAFVAGMNRANYHPAYDRGPSSGPNVWNLTAANGAISSTDFNAVLNQFGHNCN